MDIADPHLILESMRLRLLAGTPVAKSLLISTVTERYLTGFDAEAPERSILVDELFAHTLKWIVLARNSAGSRFVYNRLSVEQVALILIHRHRAVVAGRDEIPPDWDFEQRDFGRSRQPIVGFWLDRRLIGRQGTSAGPLDADAGYYSKPLQLDALMGVYRPLTTGAERARIRTLLRNWAPTCEQARLAALPEPSRTRGGAYA